MSKEHAAFLRTFGAMEPGDALQLVGGTFPREGLVANGVQVLQQYRLVNTLDRVLDVS